MTRRIEISSGAPSQRQLRVAEQIRHALADIIQRGEIHDPALETTIITIPEVRITPDLRHATVLAIPLGGKDEKTIVATLNRNAKPLRGALSRRIREMRYMPDLRFIVDDRFDEAAKIDALLHQPKVAQDLKKPAREIDETDE